MNFYSYNLGQNVETFYQIATFLEYQIYSFPPPNPQLNVVNVGMLSKQSWENCKAHETTLNRGEGGVNILYLPVSQDMRKKMCDIHLSQLVLSKIVVWKT